MTHITIIGGGIAGLATAFYLEKKANETGRTINYTLVEQSDRLGGKIVTQTVDNFVIEGGPDSFITQKPWGLQLCRDLGVTDRLLSTNDAQRNVFVLRSGRLIPFPAGYRLAIPTQFMPFALSPLISPLGKARMGLDLFIPPRMDKTDESLADFMRRRLGQEALDMIGEPLMAGIYTADPERLSIQSTFPMFIGLEQKHGSLIKAMQVAKWKMYRKKQQQTNGSTSQAGQNGKATARKLSIFTSLRGGMSELVAILQDQLTGEIQLNSQVVDIRSANSSASTGKRFEVVLAGDETRTIKTDGVVLAAPARTMSSVVQSTLPALTTALSNIRYTSTSTISLGYRRQDIISQHDLNGFGFVIPKSEQRHILACTWSSTKFHHRADDDHVLLRTFVGGNGQEHLVGLSDEALITLARMELFITMGITATPVIQRIFRWAEGAPQYDVGHLNRVADMEQMVRQQPGLYLTGSSFRGIGIPDCVKGALDTVEQIWQDIETP
ncbi:protoporphyrinogen oxidase [Anaerolineales bacterium HSG6]|nr:protoporphyrinogen oxidase [Anaerolineales bacterium HSG6]